jgi:hypothetical protein
VPIIDYETAWFALKAHIQTKRSHGATDLASKMAEIEVAHVLQESQAGYDDRPPARLSAVVKHPSDAHPAAQAG